MNNLTVLPFELLSVGSAIPTFDRAPSAVDVFQMSATLGIAHRIHYDDPYTRNEEGHRALLVQGPLQASYILQAALAWAGHDVSPYSFAFRHLSPAYVDEVITCGGEVTAIEATERRVTCSLWSKNKDGAKLTVGDVVLQWPS
jgi:hydroxyacyl-ACP dehydratase HTD2-like protein with hotdog domain